MIKFLKLFGSISIFILDRSVDLLCMISGKQLPKTCVVLYYHSILKSQQKKFSKQMKYVSQWSTPISIYNRNNYKDRQSGINVHVMITFDDGFESVMTHALPELIRYNIPAIFFIPSGYLGKEPGWGGIKSYKRKSERVINANQLRNLPHDLIEIGSHCITHPRLPEISDEEAKKEIYESKSQLEDILGKPVHAFSFPYGAFNEKHIAWCRDAGYTRVFTSLPVLNRLDSKKFVWGRISVEPSDLPIEFMLKVHGAYRWLPAAFVLKSKCRSIYQRVKRDIIQ